MGNFRGAKDARTFPPPVFSQGRSVPRVKLTTHRSPSRVKEVLRDRKILRKLAVMERELRLNVGGSCHYPHTTSFVRSWR